MYSDLNQKQMEIILYITDEINKKGYPPSVREICTAVGLKSTSTVHGYLNRLEELGYIRRDPTKPRAIEVMNQENSFEVRTVNIPLVGEITAGNPILAVESIEDVIPLPLNWFNNGSYFILRIKGDSMMEAGILDKDYAVFEKTDVARNGEIVAALIEDEEATVKRFYKENNHYRLQPENQFFEPIIAENVKILGILKGLLRNY